MDDDRELLRRYGTQAPDAQAAFAALVQRHLDLVYSVARRTVRDPHLAADVAQTVFLELARGAARFPSGTPLVAWLHVVTHRTAVDVVRREARRTAREHAAAELADSAPPTAWREIEPLLDEAVAALPPADRAAILLRFFENRSLRDVGTALGLSDDTAQKRVSRALERLRAFLQRRGVTVGAAGLAAELSGHAVVTAPAALGAAIGSAAGSVTAGVAPALLGTFVRNALLATAGTAAVAGLVFYGLRPTSPTPVPAAPAATVVGTGSGAAAMPAGRPRAVAAATARQEDPRVALLRRLLAELPAQNLPEIGLLAEDEWRAIAHAHELESAADIRVALAELRALARRKFAEVLRAGLRDFAAASGGRAPTTHAELLPYLAAPADAAMLARYEFLPPDPAGKILREPATSDLILAVGADGWDLKNNGELPPAFGETETAAIERVWRALGTAMGDEMKAPMAALVPPHAIGALIGRALQAAEPVFGDAEAVGAALKDAARAFVAARPGETLTDLAQVLPFLKDGDRFVAALRPALAQLAYLRENPGPPTDDPAVLQRYLARPLDPHEALRAVKLAWNGEQLTMTFGWSTSATSVAEQAPAP